MYSHVPGEPSKPAGVLWGLDVLGYQSMYFDRDKNKHFIISMSEGMCGTEVITTYFDIPESGVVKIDGATYRVRYDITLK